MTKLVLLRHGESQWNKENRFTGWVDVDLSPKGVDEARAAGRAMAAAGLDFDRCHTSVLKRAIKTLWLALEAMDRMWLPVAHSWRLNERHYGGLQGLNKAETAAKYGDAQVFTWRRSFDIPPPEPAADTARKDADDRRYAALAPAEFPRRESLKDTIARTLPYWHETIAPQVRAGERILIAAHGNSLRGLVKYLENVSAEAIPKVEIPTGKPLVYELDSALKPVRRYYLDDSGKAV